MKNVDQRLVLNQPLTCQIEENYFGRRLKEHCQAVDHGFTHSNRGGIHCGVHHPPQLTQTNDSGDGIGRLSAEIFDVLILNQVTYLLGDIELSHFGWLGNNNESSLLADLVVVKGISGAIEEEGQ